MAVEIVTRGQPPQEKPMSGRCCECGTVVKCKRADAKVLHGNQWEPAVWCVQCPVCGDDHLYVE